MSPHPRFVLLDALKLEDDPVKGPGFCWHPTLPGDAGVAGCWARKEHARAYALRQVNGEIGSAQNACVPLLFVARVKGVFMTPPPRGALTGTTHIIQTDMEPWRNNTYTLTTTELPACEFFDDEDRYEMLCGQCLGQWEALEERLRAEEQASYQASIDAFTAAAPGEEGPLLALWIAKNHLHVGVRRYDPRHVVFRGMGTYLENLRPEDVEVRFGVIDLLARTPARRGLQTLAFFGGEDDMVCWLGHTPFQRAAFDDICLIGGLPRFLLGAEEMPLLP